MKRSQEMARAKVKKPKSSIAQRISPDGKIGLRVMVADGAWSVLTQTNSAYWTLVAYIVAYYVRFNEKQQCEPRWIDRVLRSND